MADRCHRVTAVIALKGLQDVISSSNVAPILPNLGKPEYIGWIFNEKYPDHLHPKKSKSVLDIYRLHNPEYSNKKLTVPILFDTKTQKVGTNTHFLAIPLSLCLLLIQWIS